MPTKLSLIALGANLSSLAGSPEQTIRFAIRLISAIDGVQLKSVSRFYRTPAFPAGSGPEFVNCCAGLQSCIDPADLLENLHSIEARLGRTRENGRWSARGIDLDLLARGEMVTPDTQTFDKWRRLSPERQRVETPDRMILPHPRIQDRGFVLVPLADIAPGWRHPRSGLTVRQMLAALPAAARAEIRAFA
ncbi:2-amino-4-hydroxy-6-hydroxymethyldihydropteridine diphosphokinase [Paracoccus sediminicola]|uniref:2-amino-4-hydroxy-6- hydroxymethyldihydropteridine diphosphokinase n=1 Tax=Paracoccus sediminicola TaxID=3017783 RepID=UPI0022F141DC|nr:2-amino-4-hydroxy-6-hydroxymethyldihydropteridine diphosphokinase [Paracoccus sediminicola]WBU55529.1 2-amino-4-hydroxy-6-hydroxymethyldihydropteridine diphosphokinase [Paracoccus sediminicola]